MSIYIDTLYRVDYNYRYHRTVHCTGSAAELSSGIGIVVQKEALDVLHLQKIDRADVVVVLNVGGYVGESTRREIAYARQRGLTLHFLEQPDIGAYEVIAEELGILIDQYDRDLEGRPLWRWIDQKTGRQCLAGFRSPTYALRAALTELME